MPSHFPHFIESKLVHHCNFNISKKVRSKLALVRSLQLYEINKKQILNSIDLRDTILGKLQYKFDSLELEVNGAIPQEGDVLASSKSYRTNTFGAIMFGKYIFQCGSETVVYILIKCWNVMVVIKKTPNGFNLQAEYENVRSFHLVKGSNYQVQVSISFQNNDHCEITNFQERSESLLQADLLKADAYKKMIENIKTQKSELLVHRAITKKEFAKLKNAELFGCNILRTPRLEEMQILSKCGNSWIKLTANDDVVIGVPIANNCTSRLTILQNFRAVLQGVPDSSYTFKIYQLVKSFYDLESVDDFFNDTGSSDTNSDDCSWRECLDLNLRPESFTILILRLKMIQIFKCGVAKTPLFVCFDICTFNRTFNQKCFLTTITLEDIFTNESFRLKFDERNLHCDLLTVIASSYKTEIRLEYLVTGNAFISFLSEKLGFHMISQSQSFSDAMNIDEQEDGDEDVPVKEKFILYNKNQNSIWHGTLLEIAHVSESVADVTIFTKSQEKSKVLLKQLGVDLKASLGIKDVRENLETLSTKLIKFEAALRDECSSCLEIYSKSAMEQAGVVKLKDMIKLHKCLHLQQLKTDLFFKDIIS